MKLIANKFLIILTLCTLCSCQTIDVRGQYVDDNAISKLENEKLTKDQVIDLIGTPTIVPDYTPDTWYYIQRSLARRAWLTPKVVEQRIVELRFNNRGIMEKVTVLNDFDQKDINVISEYTRTYGTEQNGIQKFIKNIGRFNTTTDDKKGRRR